MPEIELLPKWYPQLRRRRRLVTAQLWAGGIFTLTAGVYLFALRSEVSGAVRTISKASAELTEVRNRLAELDRLVAMRKELETRKRLHASLGRTIEVSRLLSELDACMPPTITLTEAQTDVIESTRTAAQIAEQGPGAAAVTRRLTVRIRAVAPTEVEVTSFYSKLAARRFFLSPTIVTSSDLRDGDHVMREFEMRFEVLLDYRSED